MSAPLATRRPPLSTLIAAAALSPITLQPSSRGETTAEQPNQLPKQLHPIFADSSAPASTTRAVAPTELAGRVVDEQGRPLEGVNVDAWTWHPGNETKTDADGRFSLSGFENRQKIEVEFTKPSLCPALFPSQPAGTADWTVQLNDHTYLEGKITDSAGKPAAQQKVRASRGPFQPEPGYVVDEVWTETTTDDSGHYRLYLQPDIYNVQIRVPGVGLARYEHVAVHDGDKTKFDIELKPGPDFRAHLVDSQTGEPVKGIRLWNWLQSGIEGSSDSHGDLVIENMLPGRFDFQVTASGEPPSPEVAGQYARWWSPEAKKPGQTLDLNGGGPSFQRNFDDLSFDIREGMPPVSIFIEKCVTIHGRVLDPDGLPVAGATVAPAKTGSGNSITGDTRFSVRTAEDGTFTLRLPASGVGQYNLLAHDGDNEQWRTWANGTNEPFQTKPGDVLQDVELKLSSPCIVRGRVVDSAAIPYPNSPFAAESADKRANRYYDPTTKTDAKGEFELRFVSPGNHFVQAGEFWMPPENGPNQAWKLVATLPDQPVENVELIVARPHPHIELPSVNVSTTTPAASATSDQPAGNNESTAPTIEPSTERKSEATSGGDKSSDAKPAAQNPTETAHSPSPASSSTAVPSSPSPEPRSPSAA